MGLARRQVGAGEGDALRPPAGSRELGSARHLLGALPSLEQCQHAVGRLVQSASPERLAQLVERLLVSGG